LPFVRALLIFLLHCGDLFASQYPKVRRCLSDGLLSRVLRTRLGVVLINLGEEIRECYRHAEDCARKATAQPDPKRKQDFLDLEQRWLFLARSYEFTQRLTECSDETKRQADKLP
jgi:hypothetical protein